MLNLLQSGCGAGACCANPVCVILNVLVGFVRRFGARHVYFEAVGLPEATTPVPEVIADAVRASRHAVQSCGSTPRSSTKGRRSLPSTPPDLFRELNEAPV